MNRQKHFTLFAILTSFIVLFSGCGGGASGGAIFSAIEGEVKLGKRTTPWAIRSLVMYGNQLYCTNGNKIYTKGYGAQRGWTALTTSYDGAIGLLAADEDNLYVLTYTPSTEITSEDQGTYNYSDMKLNVLYGPATGAVGLSNVMTIFDNKSYNGGREAFATRYGGETFQLNGTATPTRIGSGAASAVKTVGSSQLHQTFISTSDYTNSRAWYVPLDGNGSAFLTPTTTNGSTTYKYNSPQFRINGVGAGVPSFDLSKLTVDNQTMSESKHGKISGLAYYEETVSGVQKEYLLVSTTSGYYRIALDGTNAVHRCPHANGERLAGQGIIEGSFWTLPTGAIYAGITASDKTRYGLWAYYPNDAWNVD